MAEKLTYTVGDGGWGQAGNDFELKATLAIFDLPPTTMTFNSNQSLPGPVWLQSFHDDTTESSSEELAQKVHIKAQEHEYKEDRERRLRSMARTWALVGAGAVTATT